MTGSSTSVVASAVVPSDPPAIRTWSSTVVVALAPVRGLVKVTVATVPPTGSMMSAVACATPATEPPTTTMWPSRVEVTAAPSRGAEVAPPGPNAPAAGS